MTVTDSNGNKIQKSVFIDDQDNLVEDSDISYEEEV